MYGLVVKLRGSTASYREPNAQLYHETLPLPTPTTLVGIGGAALGLSMEEALAYFKDNTIHVGCQGTHEGKGKDLWNYNKIKQGGKVDKDIIMREFLYDIHITLYYSSCHQDAIDKLAAGFLNPIYAITLGSSDDLVSILTVARVNSVEEKASKDIKRTWVYDVHRPSINIDWDYINNVTLTETIQPPMIKNIPVDFTFEADGARKASKHIHIAYMNPHTILDEDVRVYKFSEDVMLPLYGYTP